MTMSIDLSAQARELISEKLKSGAFATAEEVVVEALRSLAREEERLQKLSWLQAEIDKGFDSPSTPWTTSDSNRLRELVSETERNKNDRRENPAV